MSNLHIPTASQILSDPKFHRLAKLLNGLNAKWKPHDKQKEIGSAIFSEGARKVFIECGRKFGKALALDTPIMTPFGFKNMGDIKVGDFVMDETGTPCEVLIATDTMFNHKCFEVKFSDETKIVADAGHKWLTNTKTSRKSLKRNKGKYKSRPIKKASVVTTEDIYKSLKVGKEFNHSIPCAKMLDLENKKLPLDPYLFGVWLGDGTSKQASISGKDPEIFEAFIEQGFHLGFDHGITKGIKGLKVLLRELKVLGNKHIPTDYLLGSVPQRLSLLQGLMDTDGTIGKNGYCCFDNTNKSLADGVAFLIASLGGQCKRTSRIPKCKGKAGALCHRVMFMPKDIVPFRLNRKISRLKIRKKPNHRFIISVKPINSVPVRCIGVSSPSHLFLAGESLIPTHNTDFAVDVCWRLGNMIQNGQGYYFAALAKSAREIVWKDNRLKEHGPSEYIKAIHETDGRITFTSNTFVKVEGADEYQAVRGFNPDFVVLDEFGFYPDGFWKAMSPNFASKDCIVIIISSPPEELEEEPGKPCLFIRLADAWAKRHKEAIAAGKKSKYRYYNFTIKDNPYISKEWIKEEEQTLRDMGEEDVWEREYLAKRVIGGGRRIVGTFSKEKHVYPHDKMMKLIEKQKSTLQWATIVDPSTSTFGALVMAVNPYSKEAYFFDEIYEKEEDQTTEHIIWPKLAEMEKELYDVDDPERFLRIYDEAEKWWQVGVSNEFLINFLPTEKAVHPISMGLSLLRTLFLYNKGYVSDRCKWFAWELENYRKNRKGMIPDMNNHLIDCGRYGLHALGYYLLPEERTQNIAPHLRAQQAQRHRTLEQDVAEDTEAYEVEPWERTYDKELDECIH